jgi:hypothetical protein
MIRPPLQIATQALEEIERGRAAGSAESTLANDGSWREYARELQRIARRALREMRTDNAETA